MSLFAAISLGPEGIAGVTQPLWDIKLKVWTELPGGVTQYACCLHGNFEKLLENDKW